MSGATLRAATVLPLAPRRRTVVAWVRDDGDEDPSARSADDADDGDEAAQVAEPDLGIGIGFDTDTPEINADTVNEAVASRSEVSAAGAAAADDSTLIDWITRIARQDERALEALYDATAARVHGVVLRITQRAALAEEVVEDTYWQVWRQAPRFDEARGRPITWLLSMARSRAIDALRREQRYRHEELPPDDLAVPASDALPSAPAPTDLLEATRGHAHVHAALASLEPRSRQLVALAFLRGLTHEEIAEQQGLPLGTVKSLIRRALAQLKRVIEAEHA